MTVVVIPGYPYMAPHGQQVASQNAPPKLVKLTIEVEKLYVHDERSTRGGIFMLIDSQTCRLLAELRRQHLLVQSRPCNKPLPPEYPPAFAGEG
eukprot:4923441-Amphidinium_carterae.1